MGKIEQIIKYKTTDGQMFDFYYRANIHQEILDGVKKGCNSCLNSGKVFDLVKNDDGHTYHVIDVICDKCNGKGYIE